jgi:hypothetical protein
MGSSGLKLLFAECAPIRGFARSAERPTEPAASDGQHCPLSNANVESRELALAQLGHGPVKLCPDAINHSAGNKATNVTFTRSIAIQLCHARRLRLLQKHRGFVPDLITFGDPLAPVCSCLTRV